MKTPDKSFHAEIPEISVLDKVSAGAGDAQRAGLSKGAPSNPHTLRIFLTHFPSTDNAPEQKKDCFGASGFFVKNSFYFNNSTHDFKQKSRFLAPCYGISISKKIF